MKEEAYLPAKSIDEVLVQMKQILDECTSNNDKVGYFAALYYTVTCRIRDGVKSGEFQDNVRMERLDVLFANRYLEAYHIWKNGGNPTASWKTAFEATRLWSPIVLQDLLLGMNAHINLDLGIATVQTMAEDDITKIHSDFNHINTILASMVYKVIKDLNQVSPMLSLLGFHATNTNMMLAQFTIEQARDGAWVFAEELSAKKGKEYDDFIILRDQKINKLATNLAYPKKMAKITIVFIRLFEMAKPNKIIQILRGGL